MAEAIVGIEPIWHDGNLVRLSIEGTKSHSVWLELSLLESPATQTRRQAVLRAEGVRRLAIVGDFSELARQAFAGQIADARIDKLAAVEVLRMQLAAGYLEIEADRICFD
jgi:hypothetical protein